MIAEQGLSRRVDPPRLQVNIVDPATDHRWATLVASHPEGLAYHHPAYLQALTDAFGYAPAHLACEDADGNLHGVLPLVYWRGPFRDRQLWSLPRTPAAGPLATSSAAKDALVRAAIELTENEAGHRLQIKSVDPDLAPANTALRRVEWWPAHVIQLPDRSEPPRFSKSRRRGINKAKSANVHVREAESLADVRAWYQLYLQVLRQKGSPPLPFRFFEAIWRRMHPHGLLRLLLAERSTARGRELLAGTMLLPCAQTVIDAFAADRADARRHHPSDLLLGTAIYAAWEASYRIYDLGHVPPGEEGLAQFKRTWGATPRPTFRYYYPAHHTRMTYGWLHSRGLAMRLMQGAWRLLPLGLIELIGGAIYARM
ncbi:MAG: GNAT family N-acetyltransferase [Sphaerobacter sp.]|nr:GNAT family N-acetyltransferase [Sphaerobacter sp.]